MGETIEKSRLELVPAQPDQLQRLGNDKKAYDLELRPTLMVQAIHELQDAGVEPDVGKEYGGLAGQC
jgi:5-dehydro-2-deoxygluconokinase